MQEGQDRSGDQPPEYLGAWSPIPAGDQPDRPAGDEPAAAENLAEQDEPAAPEGTWIIPAAGDQRSGTQGPDAAGPVPQHGLRSRVGRSTDSRSRTVRERASLSTGWRAWASAASGGETPGSAPQARQAGSRQQAYDQPGGYAQPGYGQPGYGASAAGGYPGRLPAGRAGPARPHGSDRGVRPAGTQPANRRVRPARVRAARIRAASVRAARQYGQAAGPGGYGQPGEPGQPGGYGQAGGYGQQGGYGQPGGYGRPRTPGARRRAGPGAAGVRATSSATAARGRNPHGAAAAGP